MQFKVKDMDVATGGVMIAVINQKDAEKFDIHAEDRLIVQKAGKITIVMVDVGESSKAVPPGSVGLFEEVLDALQAVDGDDVHINFDKKPESLTYILKKLNGHKLSKKELLAIVKDIANRRLTDIEMTYFVAGTYSAGMTSEEIKNLTLAMVETGDVLKLKSKIIADKHCIGGVPGNRTTMVVVPIVAAAGITIPKTSSRSITSPAGTGDTMEVIANVSLPLSKIKEVVEKHNACIVWGGAINLAPADDQIIKVERPINIDAEGQMIASILAKKKSVSATHLLIDIPVGKTAKVKTKKHAVKLGKHFEEISRLIGIKTKIVISDGSQPIGNGIGPALEARDVLLVLKNDPAAPQDLRNKAIDMAAALLELVGDSKGKKAKQKAKDLLTSGQAFKKMEDIAKAQGLRCIDPAAIIPAKHSFDVLASRSGKVSEIDNFIISKIARVAGAPADQNAGIYLYLHKKAKVRSGDILYTIYARSIENLNFAKELVEKDTGITLKS